MQTWAQVFTGMRGADVSFRDVTIKIPIRGMWPGIWVTSRTGRMGWDLRKVSWVEFCLGGRRLTFASSPWPCGRCLTWFGGDGKVSIERWYLSSYVEKLFNSKVIKSFVRELRSRVFRVSRFLCSMYICYEHSVYISHIHVWLCYTVKCVFM